MTWRAYVEHDHARHGVAIHLVQRRHLDGTPISYALQPTALDLVPVAENATSQPGLTMPEDLARALLDALSAHYGGTSDTRQLRKDFEHERARVDKFIAHHIKD